MAIINSAFKQRIMINTRDMNTISVAVQSHRCQTPSMQNKVYAFAQYAPAAAPLFCGLSARLSFREIQRDCIVVTTGNALVK